MELLLQSMQAQMQAQAEQIASLTAAQSKTTEKPVPEDKGGVWVKQWRTIMDEDKHVKKVDEQEQYYASDVYDRMTTLRDGETEADLKDSFGHNGYTHVITKDTRKKKK